MASIKASLVLLDWQGLHINLLLVRKKLNGGKIFGDGSTSTTSPGSGLGSVGAGGSFTVPLGRRTSASALLQAASTGGTYGISSELTAYLDSDTVN